MEVLYDFDSHGDDEKRKNISKQAGNQSFITLTTFFCLKFFFRGPPTPSISTLPFVLHSKSTHSLPSSVSSLQITDNQVK